MQATGFCEPLMGGGRTNRRERAYDRVAFAAIVMLRIEFLRVAGISLLTLCVLVVSGHLQVITYVREFTRGVQQPDSVLLTDQSSVLLSLTSDCPSLAPTAHVTYPKDLVGEPAARIVLFGKTGSGKSTFVNILAGGVPLAPVSNGSQSRTIGTTIYRINWGGPPGSDVAEIADTPGFDDTCQRDVPMAERTVEAMRDMRETDIVVLFVDSAEFRCTDAFAKDFTDLRSYFKPQMWHKLVIVYTLWNWEDCTSSIFCWRYRTETMLLDLHRQVIQCGFDKVRSTFGDHPCTEPSDRQDDCLPNAEDIHFIGSGLSFEAFQNSPETLSESSYATRPNNIQQINVLKRLAINTNRREKPYNMADMDNFWIACERDGLGKFNQARITTGSSDEDVCMAAANLSLCIQGGIQPQIQQWSSSNISDNPRMQLRYGFCFDEKTRNEIVRPEYGFQPKVVSNVRMYANLQSYDTCEMARTDEISLSAAEKATRCYMAKGKQRDIWKALDDFYSSQERRRENFRFRLGFFVRLVCHKQEGGREPQVAASRLLELLVPSSKDRARLHLYSDCGVLQAWDDNQSRCRPVCHIPELPKCPGGHKAVQLSQPPSQLSFNKGAYFENAVVKVELSKFWAKLPNFIATGLAVCGRDSDWQFSDDWLCNARTIIACPRCDDPTPCETRQCESTAGKNMMWEGWQDQSQRQPICEPRRAQPTKYILGAGSGMLVGCGAGITLASFIIPCVGPVGQLIGCIAGGVSSGLVAGGVAYPLSKSCPT